MPAKVVVRNLLRVWKEVDELAAKLQKTIEDDITHLAESKFLQEIYDSMASRVSWRIAQSDREWCR